MLFLEHVCIISTFLKNCIFLKFRSSKTNKIENCINLTNLTNSKHLFPAMSNSKSRSTHSLAAASNAMNNNDQGFYQNLSVYRAQNQIQPVLSERWVFQILQNRIFLKILYFQKARNQLENVALWNHSIKTWKTCYGKNCCEYWGNLFTKTLSKKGKHFRWKHVFSLWFFQISNSKTQKTIIFSNTHFSCFCFDVFVRCLCVDGTWSTCSSECMQNLTTSSVQGRFNEKVTRRHIFNQSFLSRQPKHLDPPCHHIPWWIFQVETY